jgi:hypothetical protein
VASAEVCVHVNDEPRPPHMMKLDVDATCLNVQRLLRRLFDEHQTRSALLVFRTYVTKPIEIPWLDELIRGLLV